MRDAAHGPPPCFYEPQPEGPTGAPLAPVKPSGDPGVRLTQLTSIPSCTETQLRPGFASLRDQGPPPHAPCCVLLCRGRQAREGPDEGTRVVQGRNRIQLRRKGLWRAERAQGRILTLLVLARWLGHRPRHRNVMGSIPGQGANGRQPIDISLPPLLSL